MSPLPILAANLPLTLPPSLLRSEAGEPVHAGNPAAEILFVFLLLIVFWGAFRIMSRKRPEQDAP